MIKNINYIFLLILFAFCSSCQDKEEENPLTETEINAKRKNIVGDWSLNSTTQWIHNDGSVGLEKTAQSEISFLPEGTGYKYTDTSTIFFNWLYQIAPERIIIMDEGSINTNDLENVSQNQIYTILQNEKNKQEWKVVLSENSFNWKKIQDK